MKSRTVILDHIQIQRKIKRIAHQIIENNYQEERLVLVGIEDRGAILSKRLANLLNELCSAEIIHFNLSLDKDAQLSAPVKASFNPAEIENQTIILVDDVLNTGKALIHATHHIIGCNPKGMQTVVLVDRRHRNFPIRADYVGLTLATTLQEHISVAFGSEDCVYLE